MNELKYEMDYMFHTFSQHGKNIKLHLIEVGNKDLKHAVIFFLLEVDKFFSLINNLSVEHFRIILIYRCEIVDQDLAVLDFSNEIRCLTTQFNMDNVHCIFEPNIDDFYKYALFSSDLFDSVTVSKKFDELCLQAFFASCPRKIEATIDFIEKVNLQIGHTLSEGEPYLIKVAKKMRLTPRVLSKRIRSEGEEFKLLVKQIRHEKALFLLKNENVSLCDIAYTLGYTEHSAFTRAFRGWTGCSPCQFRKYLK